KVVLRQQHEAEQRRFAVIKPADMGDHPTDLLPEVRSRGADCVQFSSHLQVGGREQRPGKFVLAAVMPIQRALRDAGSSGDLADRYAVKTLLGEQLERCPFDLRASAGGP